MLSKVSKDILSSVGDDLRELEKQDIEYGDPWKHSEVSRKTKIITPKVVTKVLPHIASISKYAPALRKKMSFRLREKVILETEQKEGRLHQRMLSRSTDLVFHKSRTVKTTGLSLCLLLDESGSMGYLREKNGNLSKAAQVGYLFCKALQGLPHTELEIYSYSSYGECDYDNQVKYLYGKRQKKLAGISAYNGGKENYDHVAILEAAKLFRANTIGQCRVMIVVSDGEPAGSRYGGESARELAKKAVLKVTKGGIHVIGVAINNYDIGRMYPEFVKFTNMATLIANMSKLLVKIVKKHTSYT